VSIHLDVTCGMCEQAATPEEATVHCPACSGVWAADLGKATALLTRCLALGIWDKGLQREVAAFLRSQGVCP
jgi:Zn-finger nucleic acid-binding protein